jgi:hypothetical protein
MVTGYTVLIHSSHTLLSYYCMVTGYTICTHYTPTIHSLCTLYAGYTRGVRLVGNEFGWLGMSAMVAWGRTGTSKSSGDTHGADGYDGTTGEQPRGTLVFGNRHATDYLLYLGLHITYYTLYTTLLIYAPHY